MHIATLLGPPDGEFEFQKIDGYIEIRGLDLPNRFFGIFTYIYFPWRWNLYPPIIYKVEEFKCQNCSAAESRTWVDAMKARYATIFSHLVF